jgi:undecaprenyl-diphosphatase
VGIGGVHTLNQLLLHHDWLEDPILGYDSVAEWLYLGMLVVVIALAAGVRRAHWRRAAVAASLSAGLALAIGKIIANAVDRQRPFVAHPRLVHLFAPHVADAGFPSDHATAAFAIAVAIAVRRRRWGAVVGVFAAILAFARVALGYHYPTDVIGGAVLGTLVAGLLWTPPLRALVDRISDSLGGVWDRAVARPLGERLGIRV